MPIYEYRCQNCNHELEALQKISDEELTQCPECEQPRLKKLMSAAGFRLKGSGWYETDFKKDNQRNLHESGDGKGSSDKKDSGDKKTAETKGGEKSSSKAKAESSKSSDSTGSGKKTKSDSSS